jgi:hypothetical protein
VNRMFVLLQICPQAIGPDDLHDPIDVIGVDVSRERLEQYLTAYRERHRVACTELEARLSEYGDDWEAVHDHVHDEIADKHRSSRRSVTDMDDQEARVT